MTNSAMNEDDGVETMATTTTSPTEPIIITAALEESPSRDDTTSTISPSPCQQQPTAKSEQFIAMETTTSSSSSATTGGAAEVAVAAQSGEVVARKEENEQFCSPQSPQQLVVEEGGQNLFSVLPNNSTNASNLSTSSNINNNPLDDPPLPPNIAKLLESLPATSSSHSYVPAAAATSSSSSCAAPANLNSPDYWLAAVLQGRYLNELQVGMLCRLVDEILIEEPNVIQVASPVTVVGDIHGQFYDLRYMFDLTELQNNTKYVFLGDYVDRGHYSVETITLLLVLKIKYPESIVLLRGNHESRTVTQSYGFFEECFSKYGNANVWNLFCSTFDYLPIAAVVDNKTLCLHGGLTPLVKSIDRMHYIERVGEIPNSGALCHLLWSDPDPSLSVDWFLNPRGAGVLFGENAHRKFCEHNDIDLICRAHQLAMEGHQYFFDNTLITVWSAPNYCYRNQNAASVLKLNNGSQEVMTFNAVPDNERKVPSRVMIPYFL